MILAYQHYGQYRGKSSRIFGIDPVETDPPKTFGGEIIIF